MSAFALHPRRGRRVAQLEARLARELATVQSRLSAAARAALPDTGEPLTPASGKRLLARLAAVAKSSRATATAARRAARTAAQLVALGAQDAAEELEEELGRASFADPPLVDEEDVRTYHQVAAQMVDKLAADHYDQLRRVVEQGLREGATDREIGGSIARLDIGLSRAHANTWARTESTRFYTLGRVQQAEEAGDYVWGYEYVVIEDTRTTDICRGFIGKRVSKEEANRFPPFHYSCRTTVKSVLREDITGRPEQPPGTELGPDAEPAEGFGDDPRGPIRRTDPEQRKPPKPVKEASPVRLPDEDIPPRQTHQGGPRSVRKQERAVDEAHAAWVKAGSPKEGAAYDRFATAWQQLAQRRQQMIRRSAVGLTPRDEVRAAARIRKTLTRLQREQVEHGVIFDRRGRVLWQGTSNLRYQIRYPGDDLPGGSPAEQWEGAIFAHNHPPQLGSAAQEAAAGFGDADLFGLATRRAHASHVVYSWQGRWYQQEVGPPAGGWRDADPGVLQDLLAEANVRSQRREAELIQRNERLSADEAHYDHWHEALMELRNSGLISYDRTVLVD